MHLRKAVVPLAGLGTRHFPASHAVKKELFPVVGPDGVARALFHYHLLDLVEAGIEEICLIVQPGDETSFIHYLQQGDPETLRRLEQKHPRLAAEAEAMPQLLERITFAVQHEQHGYGHAVYQAADFSQGEPVLLCLGDHLFRGDPVSPYRELAEAWAESDGRSVSAVNRIGPDDLKGFGTIAGQRIPGRERWVEVSRIVEKPDVDVAREHLRVDGLGPDEFLGWFGMHLLAPSIFEILARMIRDDLRDGGEIQMTRAQELQREQEGYLALEMTAAVRYDFGIPADYVDSLVRFARPGLVS